METQPPVVPQLPLEMWEEMKPLFAARFPVEAAVAIHGDKWRELPNANPNPAHAWTATPSDAVWLHKNPPDLLIHSHPTPFANDFPSDFDLQSQVKHGWNYGLVCVSGNVQGEVYEVRYPECWGPEIPVAPLLGRTYLFGIRDCVTVCWDYYEQNGFRVPRVHYVKEPGTYPPTSREYNQFERLPLEVGMREVGMHERKPGDLVIMRFGDSNTHNHCAIYMGEGKYLHQPITQLSHEWRPMNEEGIVERLNMRFYRPKRDKQNK